MSLICGINLGNTYFLFADKRTSNEYNKTYDDNTDKIMCIRNKFVALSCGISMVTDDLLVSIDEYYRISNSWEEFVFKSEVRLYEIWNSFWNRLDLSVDKNNERLKAGFIFSGFFKTKPVMLGMLIHKGGFFKRGHDEDIGIISLGDDDIRVQNDILRIINPILQKYKSDKALHYIQQELHKYLTIVSARNNTISPTGDYIIISREITRKGVL